MRTRFAVASGRLAVRRLRGYCRRSRVTMTCAGVLGVTAAVSARVAMLGRIGSWPMLDVALGSLIGIAVGLFGVLIAAVVVDWVRR